MADVTDPILGVIFFVASNWLVIDMSSKLLISLDDLSVVRPVLPASVLPCVVSMLPACTLSMPS